MPNHLNYTIKLPVPEGRLARILGLFDISNFVRLTIEHYLLKGQEVFDYNPSSFVPRATTARDKTLIVYLTILEYKSFD